MKKIVLISLFCFLTAGWVFGQKAGSTMYVAVQSAALKTSTGFFAGNAGTLKYGDEVKVVSVSGKWTQVRSAANSSLSGWTSSTNLTTKRIVVQGNNSSASAKELALAGKGFSEEVEKEYKTGKDLNYDAVDALELVKIPDDDLLQFLNEGHLAKGE
jgi:uncharacterized protein YgiM (DUF1202 family)